MKKVLIFFKKILLLLLLFFIVDYLSGIALKRMFYKQTSGKYYTTTHGLLHAEERIMIFGNSHANEHFNAPLMERRLKQSTFNFGNQGQSILYQYPLIKSILKDHQPKLVIITLDAYALQYIDDDYHRLSIYLPFRGLNSYVDSAIALINKNEIYKSLSSLYRYNSALGYILLSTYKSGYNKSYESKGYDPVEGTICNKNPLKDETVGTRKSTAEFNIDNLKISYLSNLIDELNARQIKTVFVKTPMYDNSQTKDDMCSIALKKLLVTKDATFWDFSSDAKFFRKCELFSDPTHLNTIGATMFTEYVIEKLQPIL